MEARIFAGIGLSLFICALVLALVQARQGNPQGLHAIAQGGIAFVLLIGVVVLLGAVTKWKGIGGLVASSAILTALMSFVFAGAAWRIRKASLHPEWKQHLRFAVDTLLWGAVLLFYAVCLLDRVKESGWAVVFALVCAWLFAPVLYRCCFEEAEPTEQPTPALQPH